MRGSINFHTQHTNIAAARPSLVMSSRTREMSLVSAAKSSLPGEICSDASKAGRRRRSEGLSDTRRKSLHHPSYAARKLGNFRRVCHLARYEERHIDIPAYSDTLRTWGKCHSYQIVTLSRGSLVTNQSFGTCQKCHCKRGVTVNSVTVSGEICIT